MAFILLLSVLDVWLTTALHISSQHSDTTGSNCSSFVILFIAFDKTPLESVQLGAAYSLLKICPIEFFRLLGYYKA
jgi:multidrug transporter EmrE-like cation transporter